MTVVQPGLQKEPPETWESFSQVSANSSCQSLGKCPEGAPDCRKCRARVPRRCPSWTKMPRAARPGALAVLAAALALIRRGAMARRPLPLYVLTEGVAAARDGSGGVPFGGAAAAQLRALTRTRPRQPWLPGNAERLCRGCLRGFFYCLLLGPRCPVLGCAGRCSGSGKGSWCHAP